MIRNNTLLRRFAPGTVFMVTCLCGSVYAVEGGKSLYLPGKRGPLLD